MTVLLTDIIFRKSATGSSDGGAMSLTPISLTPHNNLFPNISDAQRIAGNTRYKKWFAFNNHATDDMRNPSWWFATQPVDSVHSMGVGVDSSSDTDALQGNMTEWDSDDTVEVSSSTTDSRNATVIGVDDAGASSEETVTLTGTTPVETVTIWSIVYAVVLSSTAGPTVTVKQGAAGTTRGTIGASKKLCFLWLEPSNSGEGILRINMPAQDAQGYWEREVEAPLQSGMVEDGCTIFFQENP